MRDVARRELPYYFTADVHQDYPHLPNDPCVHALAVIPIALQQLTSGQQPRIFGDDYDTPDGTCIRDYVHVLDLAQAHLAALDYLGRDEQPHDVFNVGSGQGASVRTVLEQIATSSGLTVEPIVVERRPGDPAQLVAQVDRIENVLGWRSEHDLAEIVDSAWAAWQRD